MRNDFNYSVVLGTAACELGGTWRHIADLAQGLRARGVDVSIATPARATALRREAEKAQFGWLPLVASSYRSGVDVWHLHLSDTYDPVALGLLGLRRTRGATVMTEHLPRTDASDATLGRPGEARGAVAATLKTAFKRAQWGLVDQLITVSGGAARFMCTRYGVARESVAVVRNGVPVPAGLGLEPAAPQGILNVAAFGSLIHQKGFDLLVDAATLSDGWRATVYGAGTHLGSLRARAEKTADRVVFAGRTEDALLAMKNADLVCIPSRWESSCYVALEAASVSRGVIAAAVDGVDEIVVPNQTGVLFKPGSAADLASALEMAAKSPADVTEWGRASRPLIKERFTLDQMVDATIDVYRSALEGRPRSKR